MPIFKPETNQELLKELESIENLCTKAIDTVGTHYNPYTREYEELTGPDLHNPAAMAALLKNILRRAKNCQDFVKKEHLGLK